MNERVTEGNQISKSICIVYRTEKQIVTKDFLSHSGFVFAVAKVNKISGFDKDFSEFLASDLTNIAIFADRK